MKRILFIITLFVITPGYSQIPSLPHFEKTKRGSQLIVHDKPFLMLAGELHNSSTGSAHYMLPIWKRMAQKNLNTVIAAVSWELIEPEEGKFDFSQVDSMIQGVRKVNLKLVVLWFGSWKNGKSTYAPPWVKSDTERFPLAINKNGETLNTLSALGNNTLQADSKAFVALMEHIKEIDSKEQTVIMVQIENEVGLLDYSAAYMGTPSVCMRDFNNAANNAYASLVPENLISYLEQHKNELHPAIEKAWAKNAYKKNGTWEEIFGKGTKYDGDDWKTNYPWITEEIFSAWNYATFMGEIAKKGKEIYPLPMYVNAWLKQSNRKEPGSYPSGGPQSHLIDIYRAAAPSIDFIAPDIYAVDEFDWLCEEYSQSGNPLFIPETKVDTDGASRAFYAVGKYKANCYSPFGIDGGGLLLTANPDDKSIDKVYQCLTNLDNYIQESWHNDKMTGLFIDKDKKIDRVEIGQYVISIERPSFRQSIGLLGVQSDNKNTVEEIASGLIIFQLADNEFLVSGGVGGTLVRVTKSDSNQFEHVDYASVDEITYSETGQILNHRLNGDETAFGGPVIKPGEVKIFKIKMYGY